ncbi:MAG: ATP-binding cassette domain-containing protein [Syntrophobacteraceae bacterium]|jgi:phospholipid/cholesterol/gamma-HCH transport system ATP-binding protein|nr:ATP-binding cassette domain-containing protein [Syntrophobacteraceae bacterium]
MALVEEQSRSAAVRVENLTIGYGERVVLEAVDLTVWRGEIVTILGRSGCGKSTLLKVMIGLLPPLKGSIALGGRVITGSGNEDSLALARKKIGVLFQSGALMGSLTLAENVALPIQELTTLSAELVDDIVRLKLEMVGLAGFDGLLPAELSGGMRKRAALARAIALDPEILFCDEPSAGLDPVTSAELDHLLLELKRALGITMVLVTHELPSIEAISDRCVMLDGKARGIIAMGAPAELRESSTDPRVQAFFHRRARPRT